MELTVIGALVEPAIVSGSPQMEAVTHIIVLAGTAVLPGRQVGQ